MTAILDPSLRAEAALRSSLRRLPSRLSAGCLAEQKNCRQSQSQQGRSYGLELREALHADEARAASRGAMASLAACS